MNDHNKVAATFVSVGHQKIVEIGVPSRRFEQRYSGHDKSNVDASTTAYQENWLAADQSQNVMAGIGGNGGDGNKAEGGDVHYKASIESANLNDVLNNSEHFHIDDFVHV